MKNSFQDYIEQLKKSKEISPTQAAQIDANSDSMLASLLNEKISDAAKIEMLRQTFDSSTDYSMILEGIPSLDSLKPDDAKALLLRVLTMPSLKNLEIEDESTKALAVQVALENFDQLQDAPWDLIDTPASIPLYTKLAEKFNSTNQTAIAINVPKLTK